MFCGLFSKDGYFREMLNLTRIWNMIYLIKVNLWLQRTLGIQMIFAVGNGLLVVVYKSITALTLPEQQRQNTEINAQTSILIIHQYTKTNNELVHLSYGH